MTLKKIGNKIACADCDSYFDERLSLQEGGRCPNSACASNAETAIGLIIKQTHELAKAHPFGAVHRAMAAMVPVRADTAQASDEAVLESLNLLRLAISATIASIHSNADKNSQIAQFSDGFRNNRVLYGIPPLRWLAYELDGVIIDVEEGQGFDNVCLETLKRIRQTLVQLEPGVPKTVLPKGG